MRRENQSSVSEFHLLGLPIRPEQQDRWNLHVTHFLVFLPIYLVSLLGNTGMKLLICMDTQLHTPIYFFLSKLSLLDACYSSAISPKMLVDLLMLLATIPYTDCVLHMFVIAGLADAEPCLLVAMAYDCYVAIKNTLLYTRAMLPCLCLTLLGASGQSRAVSAVVHTTFTFCLIFCSSQEVKSFFYDIPPLLAISFNDTCLNELLFAICSFIQTATVLTTAMSYGFIAASSCASHLMAVAMLSIYALESDKMSSVFYTLVIPVLNPFIYSFCNNEVKEVSEGLGAGAAVHGRYMGERSQQAGKD
uniref:G-protein coupled receptors family 1 profile domain-containing protein n=1 Tax=Sus scrofa TaxID=9823 RepID=A0A8D0VWM3_PIG